MRRTAFDERRDQQIANEFSSEHGSCSECGQSTLKQTLVALGARCDRCYTQYVTQGKPYPPAPTPERRKQIAARLLALSMQNGNPRAWAYRLKAKEEAGEPMSRVQREAWRAAIGHLDAEAA